jgi:small-conductance mechanosensitive channel
MKEEYIKKILKIITIIIFTFLLATYYKNLILNKYIIEGKTSLLIHQFASIIYYSIIAFGFIIILIQVGIEKSTILTIFVTIGFTIGLSLQNILSRSVSGIYIMLGNLYKIGDYVEAGKNKGYVKKFNFFNTTLYNEQNKVDILIPNNLIDSNVLINYTNTGLNGPSNL